MASVSRALGSDSTREEGRPNESQSAASPPLDQAFHPLRGRRVWRPPTDVYETGDRMVIKVEIAGMKADDFDITVAGNRLAIGGQRRDQVGKLVYQNMEIHYGEFRTEVRVDWPLDQATIEATYESGFLFVRLPLPKKHRVPIRDSARTEP